ncbi:TBC1 domain family member 25-like [Mustelus asterias]
MILRCVHGSLHCSSEKCEGLLPPEFRSFAVDPQITSFEVLQHILIRAFDLSGKKNFVISYLSPERPGQEVYLSLQSDWDLDVAFSSLSKAQLQLKVDIKSSEDSEYPRGIRAECSELGWKLQCFLEVSRDAKFYI